MTDAGTTMASEDGAARFVVAPEVWTTPERRALSQMARSFVEREIAPKLGAWVSNPNRGFGRCNFGIRAG